MERLSMLDILRPKRRRTVVNYVFEHPDDLHNLLANSGVLKSRLLVDALLPKLKDRLYFAPHDENTHKVARTLLQHNPNLADELVDHVGHALVRAPHEEAPWRTVQFLIAVRPDLSSKLANRVASAVSKAHKQGAADRVYPLLLDVIHSELHHGGSFEIARAVRTHIFHRLRSEQSDAFKKFVDGYYAMVSAPEAYLREDLPRSVLAKHDAMELKNMLERWGYPRSQIRNGSS